MSFTLVALHSRPRVVSLAAVFWAVTQRSTQKKRLLTSELHSFLIVLAVCLRSFEQTNHVKMGLTDLRDSRCVSVVLIKAFLTRECAHAHERVIAIVDFSLGRSVGWLVGSVVNFRACAVNEF